MIRKKERLIFVGTEQRLSDYQTMFFANGKSNSSIQEAPLQPSRCQNWAQFVLRGLQDFLHVVSQDGRIRYVSESCETVVGHERVQLLGHVVHNFIHPDDLEIFTMELAHLIKCGVPTRFIYRFQAPGHRWIILESQCNIYVDPNCVSDDCDVIIMARPYSTKTNFMVDSYLEHKIAYETLTSRKLTWRTRATLKTAQQNPKSTNQIRGSLTVCLSAISNHSASDVNPARPSHKCRSRSPTSNRKAKQTTVLLCVTNI